MSRVVDYAWGRPSAASLKAAGAVAVCRYLSYDTTGKTLSKAESDGLRAAGIDIVSNWEQAGSWAEYSGGQATGRTFAAEANRQHIACGGPADRPLYFSADFNPTSLARMLGTEVDPERLHWLKRMPHPDHPHPDQPPLSEPERAWVVTRIRANTFPSLSQLDTVAEVHRGVNSVIGLPRGGAYGGYRTIKHLFDVGVIQWGWQTYAWSSFADTPGGQIYTHWDPRAQLRQVQNGVTIGGVDCDLDDSTSADFGQWGAGDTAMPDYALGSERYLYNLHKLQADIAGPVGSDFADAVVHSDFIDAIVAIRDGIKSLAGQVAAIATPLDPAAVASLVTSALIASGTNPLTAADHAGVRADVEAALADYLRRMASAVAGSQ